MIEHKIGEVFLDTENFNPPKKVKCVENSIGYHACELCSYDMLCEKDDGKILCTYYERQSEDDVMFIETTEPLTTEKL